MKIETEKSLTGAELGELLKSKVPATQDDIHHSRQKSPSALVLNEFFGESAIQVKTREDVSVDVSTKRDGI